MKRISVHVLFFAFLVLITGCSGSGEVTSTTRDASTGGVSFNFDLGVLQQATPHLLKSGMVSGTTTTITAVTVTLSRNGYSDIVADLTVANNAASGTISGLEQGYWHISADVYSDQSLIYTGSVDVNIIAGATVSAEILFDPVSVDPGTTTGSVTVSVGLNKYPGYSKIQQYVSTILLDTVKQKFYIIDSSACVLAVYDAATLVREQDITLQAAPQAAAVDTAGGSVLLGYSSGKLYRLTITDQSMTMLADTLLSISSILPVSTDFALVGNGSSWSSSNTYETINLGNGQIVSSKSYWYPLSNFVYNPVAGMAYALDSGISPADMHHLAINATTGSIDSIGDSRYHGDYSFNSPIRLFSSGTRLATGSGNMFISSSSTTDDITYAGNLGHTCTDLAADDDLGLLYVLNSDSIQKLLVIDQSTFFTTVTVDLINGPKRVFNTPDNIIVFAQPDTDYYVKAISKTSIGL